MKKIMLHVCLVLMMCVSLSAHAFLYDVEILEQTEITKLNDQELADRYVDVMVEMEASRTFHSNSGFSPEGYKKYKGLIKYRILLSIEVQKRDLEIRKYMNEEY